MKAFITLAVVCLVAGALSLDVKLSDEQKAKAKSYYEECVKQENLSDEEALKIKNKDFVNPSENIKCFGGCFLEKAGVLKDNEIQQDVAIEKLSSFIGAEKSKIVFENCKNIKGGDRCETGFNVYKCLEAEKAKLVAA